MERTNCNFFQKRKVENQRTDGLRKNILKILKFGGDEGIVNNS